MVRTTPTARWFPTRCVGGKAQIKAMKKLSGPLKLLYSQFTELKAFTQFGTDLDEATKRQIVQGERIVEVLKQQNNSPIDVACQVILVYAAVNHLLKDIELRDVANFKNGLIEYATINKTELLNQIKADGITEDVADAIERTISEYKNMFLASK